MLLWPVEGEREESSDTLLCRLKTSFELELRSNLVKVGKSKAVKKMKKRKRVLLREQRAQAQKRDENASEDLKSLPQDKEKCEHAEQEQEQETHEDQQQEEMSSQIQIPELPNFEPFVVKIPQYPPLTR